MTKIIFGVIVTIFILQYSSEIKGFTVELGIRDSVVEYLKGWGESCREMPVGLTVTENPKCN